MENMKLKDFITTALSEIIQGVADAKKLTSDTGACISPQMHMGQDFAGSAISQTERGNTATIVTFDIAITIEKGSDSSASIGVLSTFLKLGASGHSSATDASISRISFCVPVVLP